jgi:hypothetical protein
LGELGLAKEPSVFFQAGPTFLNMGDVSGVPFPQRLGSQTAAPLRIWASIENTSSIRVTIGFASGVLRVQLHREKTSIG